MTEVKLLNYYSEVEEYILVKLDKNLSANENAQKYYKKYAKLKKTAENLTPRKNEILNELNYVENLKFEITSAESVTTLNEINDELIASGIIKPLNTGDKKKKPETSSYREYVINGFIVKVGKNNIQNDALTFSASRTDIWLHVKNYHSCHAIIFTENKSVPDDVILKASEITAYFSSGKNGTKIPVDYTLKKYVKKQAGKGFGAVTYTNFKTLVVTPSEHEQLKKMQ